MDRRGLVSVSHVALGPETVSTACPFPVGPRGNAYEQLSEPNKSFPQPPLENLGSLDVLSCGCIPFFIVYVLRYYTYSSQSETAV